MYVNDGLYSSAIVSSITSSNLTLCFLLSNSGLGTSACPTNQIVMGTYTGAIDEFYIYKRELTSSEACPLAHP